MRNIWTLFRAEASETLNPRRFVERRSKKKGSAATLLLGVLVVLLMLGASAFYAFSLAKAAQELNADYVVVLLVFICADALLTLITAASTGAARMFRATNLEVLMSMPFTGFQLYAGKLCAFLAENYLYSAIILIPAFAVYAYFAAPPLLFIAAAIVMFIFVPMIPVGVGLLISAAFSRFSFGGKSKMIRNIVGVALFIGVYLWFMSASDGIMARLLLDPDGAVRTAGKFFPPLQWCLDGAALKWGPLLLFAAVSAAFIALVAFIASLRFDRSVGKVNSSAAVKGGAVRSAKAKSPFAALFRKEAAGYFSSFAYFMNTAFAPLMLIIGAVYAAVTFSGVASNGLVEAASASIVSPIVMMLVFFVVSMSSTTASAISIEGRRLPQLKAMPIRPRDVFTAKIALNLLICGAPVLAASAVVAAAGVVSPLDWAIVCVAAVCYTVFISIAGLLVNLRHPKLEWTNESAVVKQSAAVGLTMGLGMIFCAVFGAGFYLIIFKFEFGTRTFLLASAGVSALAACAAMLILKKRGEKLYNAL